MNFVDKVKVEIAAGDGGDGHMSFRHEKFIDKGGPDGGDGGDGGDVVVLASRNQNTLANFRYQKRIDAESGSPGSKQRMHGKSGEDLIVALPVGTIISDTSGQILADLTKDCQQAVIARGGKGGFGNAHFTSSVRQAPRIAEKGEKGEQLTATLELKMIADVGLVGLPNAGKSTLLSVISNAHPEIADYPFTTLIPNLGVVDVDESNSLLVADIPGLIEGAAEGKGLGDEFLRHVERTGVLLHLIDAYEEDVTSSYKIVQQELAAYKINLTKRPQIVVLTKIDGLEEDVINQRLKKLKAVLPARAVTMAISAKTKQGLKELLRKTAQVVNAQRLKKAKSKSPTEDLPVIRLEKPNDIWRVEKTAGGYLVTGSKIERFAKRTDFTSEDSVKRLHDIMKKTGILVELTRKGAEPGDEVSIAGLGVLTY
ncbi:MAG TPA: GTPase ObgE [Candidatus Binatia bacterium]|nr:GTPase ObgE [Candidatus Binatia bacterium]